MADDDTTTTTTATDDDTTTATDDDDDTTTTRDDEDAALAAIRDDPAATQRLIAGLRNEAAESRRRLRDVTNERDELKRAGLSDAERIEAEAEARGRAAAEAEYARRTLEAEIRAAAAGKLQDPADAIRYLDVDDLLAMDESRRDLTKAIDGLVTDKPYLAVTNGDDAKGTRGVPRKSQGVRSGPGGATSDQVDGDAWLRKAAGRKG